MLIRIRKTIFSTSALLLVSSLSACGGNGDSGNSNQSSSSTVVMTGVFLDSPVSGLNYATVSHSGITNDAGEYHYLINQSVTFSIGDIQLGTTTAGAVVTPLLLVNGASDASDPGVTNIVRLLLTLDIDDNPDNGIEISSTARDASAGLSFDFSSNSFEQDVQSFLDAARGFGTPLVAANDAQNHFNTSLKTSWGTMAWGTDCWNQLCQ